MVGIPLDFASELFEIAIGIAAILVAVLVVLGVALHRSRKKATPNENVIERVGPPKPHFRTGPVRSRRRRDAAGSAAEPGDEE